MTLFLGRQNRYPDILRTQHIRPQVFCIYEKENDSPIPGPCMIAFDWGISENMPALLELGRAPASKRPSTRGIWSRDSHTPDAASVPYGFQTKNNGPLTLRETLLAQLPFSAGTRCTPLTQPSFQRGNTNQSPRTNTDHPQQTLHSRMGLVP